MNKYIINLGTKLFNKKIKLLNEAKKILENEKKSPNDFIYGISFGNQFCEHLEINIYPYIKELNLLIKKGIKLYYLTSLITSNNINIVNKNLKLLSKINDMHYVINDFSLIEKINNGNIVLGQIFYRTRVLIRNKLIENLVTPIKIKKYLNTKLIKKNQKEVYENTFDNIYYQKFIKENNIKAIMVDIVNDNIGNLNNLGIEIIISSPYTYVMSGRSCITHKIVNNINNTNVTNRCNKECYNSKSIETNYSNNILGKNLILSGNTIFTDIIIDNNIVNHPIIISNNTL